MEEPGRLQSAGSWSRTRLSNFTFTFHFHALEKEMATHSSVLAWRIPGMGKPGGLLSMGSHRVEHDWSDLAAAAAAAAADLHQGKLYLHVFIYVYILCTQRPSVFLWLLTLSVWMGYFFLHSSPIGSILKIHLKIMLSLWNLLVNLSASSPNSSSLA